ncbi:MAG: hypothetical protein KIT07_05710, partial [Anaerolineales bacterium]|nr:hypothetical protein [Anaerolineales bacterium]
ARLPALLPEVDRLDYAETIAELIIQIALVGVFSSLPWDISLPAGGSWALIHEVLTRLTALLPWFIALGVIDVLINAVKLLQGRWTRATRWATVLHSLASVLLLGYVTGLTIRILRPGPWDDRVFASIAWTMLAVIIFILGTAANEVRKLLQKRTPEDALGLPKVAGGK